MLAYKEGLLSAIAHDLLLRVGRFELDVEPDASAVRGRFQSGSLQVVDALVDEAPRAGVLSDADKRRIESNIANDVLETRQHQEIRFESTHVAPEGDGFHVRGELTLHGCTQGIAFMVNREKRRLVATVQLHQPDWSIRPFRAMLGTLRIKPEVTVRVSLPIAEGWLKEAR